MVFGGINRLNSINCSNSEGRSESRAIEVPTNISNSKAQEWLRHTLFKQALNLISRILSFCGLVEIRFGLC